MAKNQQDESGFGIISIGDIEKIAIQLRTMSDEFSEIQRKMKESGKQEISVRSLKTLKLGLDNVKIGLKRCSEAAFELRFPDLITTPLDTRAADLEEDLRKLKAKSDSMKRANPNRSSKDKPA